LNRVRVLLADDHSSVCERVAALLDPEFEVVGTVANGRDLLIESKRLRPDVVVLDISMPFVDGIEAAEKLQASDFKPAILFLTVEDRPEFVRAGLATGALGYVIKSCLTTDLLTAMHEILAGRQFISPLLQSYFAHLRKEDPR
jgi:DNA-binding NarL/FixJ family response regulator